MRLGSWSLIWLLALSAALAGSAGCAGGGAPTEGTGGTLGAALDEIMPSRLRDLGLPEDVEGALVGDVVRDRPRWPRGPAQRRPPAVGRRQAGRGRLHPAQRTRPPGRRAPK